jgi:type III secretion protein Q
MPSQRLLLCVGNRIGLACELRDGELHVLEEVREIMSDPGTAHAASNHLLDDIPVRLTFDVGEREISLGDLRSIQPGYVFNLGRDPRSLVNIRANGRLVGEGELVDIEGRVGVSVLRLKLEGQ